MELPKSGPDAQINGPDDKKTKLAQEMSKKHLVAGYMGVMNESNDLDAQINNIASNMTKDVNFNMYGSWNVIESDTTRNRLHIEREEKENILMLRDDLVELMYIVSGKIHGFPALLNIFFFDKKWKELKGVKRVIQENNEEEKSKQFAKQRESSAESDGSHSTLKNDQMYRKNEAERFEFNLFKNLLKFVHMDGQSGDYSRTALLFLFELVNVDKEAKEQWEEENGKYRSTLEDYLIKQSGFETTIAASIGAIYSQLPRRLQIARKKETKLKREESDCVNRDDVVDVRNEKFGKIMEMFSKILSFMQDICRRVNSKEVATAMLQAIQDHFLQTVFYPSVLESSEIDGSSVAVMFYLDMMLRTLNVPSVGKTIIEFLLDEKSEEENANPIIHGIGDKCIDDSNDLNSITLKKKEQYLPFTLKDLICTNISRSAANDSIVSALRLLRTLLTKWCPIASVIIETEQEVPSTVNYSWLANYTIGLELHKRELEMYSELLIHSGIAPVNKVHEYIRYIEASAKINGYKKEKPSGNSGVKTAEEGSGGVYGTKMLIHDPSESKVAEKNTGGDVAYPSFTSVSALNGVDSSDGYHDVRNARVYDNTIDIEELVSTRKYLMRRQGFDSYLEDAAKRYLDHKQTHLKILGYRGNEKNEESSKKLQGYIFNGKSEPASETPANDNNQNALRSENKPVHYKHCAANSNGSRKYIKQSDRLIQRVVMLLENYFSLTPEINLEVTGVITAIAASASVRNNDVFGGDSQNQEYYNREVESGVFGEEECSSCRTLDRLISFDPNELLRETELGTLWNQWLEKLKKTSFQQFEKEKIVFAGVSKVKNMKNSKDNDTQMKQEDQTNDELVQTHADDGVEINVNTKESTHDDFEDNKIIILTKTDKSLSSEDKKIIEKINEQIKLISEYPRFSQTFEMSRELRQTIQEIPNKGVLAHNKQLLPPIYTALRSLVQTAEEMRPFVPNFNGRLRRARNALMGVVELEVDLAAELEDFGSYSSTRKSLSRHEMESGDSESGIDSDGGDPSSANNKATKVLRSPPQNVNMMELLENIVILQECILEIIACLQIRREAGEDTNSVL